jgi:hypothetical protein
MAVNEANASNSEFSVAEEKTAMEADDRRASVGGYGCGMVRWVGKITSDG